jgi:hypothetical protein
MPHYWFKIPLGGTAPHLKKAKEDGGGPGVLHELRKDARRRNKSIGKAHFAPDVTSCDASVFSEEEMSEEDCNWFHERWETGGHGRPERRLEADETVLEKDSGWFRGSGGSAS